MTHARYMPFLLLILFALSLAACGGDDGADTASADDNAAGGSSSQVEVSAGDPQHGEELYSQVCITCHGPNGEGIEGLGKPFSTSEFIDDSSDAELLAFIKMGRPISDPLNTTGVDMPPKGGNPALSDGDILDIIAYMRSLQE